MYIICMTTLVGPCAALKPSPWNCGREVNTDFIQVDPDTREMLKAMPCGRKPCD